MLPGPLPPVRPGDDVPGVDEAGEPAQQREQDVEAEMGPAPPHDQYRRRGEEDGEDEEEDAGLVVVEPKLVNKKLEGL